MRSNFLVLLGALALTACGGGTTNSTGNAPVASSVSTVPNTSPNTAPTNPTSSTSTSTSTCQASQTLGPARGDNLRIDGISWLQTVGQDALASSTALVSAKAIKVRVDALADNSPIAPDRAKLIVYNPSNSSCNSFNLTGPARVPASKDPLTLATAFTATIPAELSMPGMVISVVLDSSAGRSQTEALRTLQVITPTVVPAVTETIRIIPVLYQNQPGYVNSPQSLASAVVRLHPVSQINFVMAPAISSNSLILVLNGQADYSTMQSVLNDVDNACIKLNGAQSSARTAPKCLGVFPDNLQFRPSPTSNSRIVGLSYVGGTTMLATSVGVVDLSTSGPYESSHWLADEVITVVHEYGHLLSLNHANCGNPSNIDPRLYSDGRLGGGSGYDSGRDFYFSSLQLDATNSPQFADLMSYCHKEWPSDRSYQVALNYRAGNSAPASGSSARDESSPNAILTTPSNSSAQRWLKVAWENGQWQMHAVSYAPAVLSASTMSVNIPSFQGIQSMPLRSAIVADTPEHQNSLGPYYLDLGRVNGLMSTSLRNLALLQSGHLLQSLNL